MYQGTRWVLLKQKKRSQKSHAWAPLMSTYHHPLICFPKIWDDFPSENIKSTAHKSLFNILLKNHFLEQLDEDFKCL
jgi:hypothetical protein